MTRSARCLTWIHLLERPRSGRGHPDLCQADRSSGGSGSISQAAPSGRRLVYLQFEPGTSACEWSFPGAQPKLPRLRPADASSKSPRPGIRRVLES